MIALERPHRPALGPVLTILLAAVTFVPPFWLWLQPGLFGPEAIVGCMVLSAVGAILLGFPIAFALAGIAALYGLIVVGPGVGNIFMLRLFGVFLDYILIAVPLFVFMGVMIERAGLAADIYRAMLEWVGRLHGGLAIATICAATIFAAATGVVGASVVAIGLLALPEMLRYGYSRSLASGVICAGGALGILIPPSIMLVVWGPTVGISVGALFLAAIPAGLLLAGLYIIYTWVLCTLAPQHGPAWTGAPVPLRQRVIDLMVSVVPVALLVLAVLGTIFFGLAAPTEAAALGAAGSLLLALVYRRLDLRSLFEACYVTARISAMVYMVVIGAGFLSAMFIRLRGSQLVTELVLGLDLPGALVLAAMLAIIFVLGMFIDWIGIIMITAPIFMPIAQTLGYDPLWFSMLAIVTMQTSFLTPPFAYTIFYLKGIAPPEVTTLDIYRGVIPFIALQIIGVVLIALYPELILFLPHAFGLSG